MKLLQILNLSVFLLKLINCATVLQQPARTSSSPEVESSDISGEDISRNDCGNEVVSADEAAEDSGWETGREDTPEKVRLRKRTRGKVVERVYAQFSKLRGEYSRGLTRTMNKRKFKPDNKWIKALDSYTFKDPNNANSVKAKRMGDWMAYYLFVQALRRGNIRSAWKILKGRGDKFSKEVKLLIKGGPKHEYESAFVLLYRSCIDNGRHNYCRKIRDRLFKIVYEVESVEIVSISNSTFTLNRCQLLCLDSPETMQTRMMEILRALLDYKQLMINSEPFPLQLLRAAVLNDWVDVAHILMLKYEQRHFEKSTNKWEQKAHNELVNVDLFSALESLPMVKMLLKMNFGILKDTDELMRTRVHVNKKIDQNERAEILGLMKKGDSDHDKNVYNKIIDGDTNVTLKELILSGNKKLVESYFLRRDAVRTDTSAIIYAIKFPYADVLNILLEERMALPEQAKIDEAIRLSSKDTTKKTELINAFKQYYGTDGQSLFPAEKPVTRPNGMTLFNLPNSSSATAITAAENSTVTNANTLTEISNAYIIHECNFFGELVAAKRAGGTNLLTRFAQTISTWLTGYM